MGYWCYGSVAVEIIGNNYELYGMLMCMAAAIINDNYKLNGILLCMAATIIE